MIDLAQESLIAIGEVPNFLPLRSSGKRIHISAVYRWIQRGVRGVRLEVLRIGGTSYTSVEALQRFAEQLENPRPEPLPAPSGRRQRQIEQAGKRLRAILDARKPKEHSSGTDGGQPAPGKAAPPGA